MISKIRIKLKETSGSMYIFTCVLMLVLFMLMSFFSTYQKINVLSQNIKENLQSAVIKTIVGNYKGVYNGVREGYSTSVLPNDHSFEEFINYGDLYGRLQKLMNLTKDGNIYTFYNDGKIEYSLSDLKVNVYNVKIGTGNNLERFNARTQITLKYPVKFLDFEWFLDFRIKVDAGYVNKF